MSIETRSEFSPSVPQTRFVGAGGKSKKKKNNNAIDTTAVSGKTATDLDLQSIEILQNQLNEQNEYLRNQITFFSKESGQKKLEVNLCTIAKNKIQNEVQDLSSQIVKLTKDMADINEKHENIEENNRKLEKEFNKQLKQLMPDNDSLDLKLKELDLSNEPFILKLQEIKLEQDDGVEPDQATLDMIRETIGKEKYSEIMEEPDSVMGEESEGGESGSESGEISATEDLNPNETQ